MFYLDAAGLLTAVPLQVVGSTLKPGLPVALSRTAYVPGVSALGVTALRGYDVAPDGQRFLMIKEDAPVARGEDQATLVVRLNFAEAVKASLSTR